MSKSLDEIQSELLKFRNARGWDRFHDPKSLAAAISVETAELLEHFIWETSGEAETKAQEVRESVADELADILILAANLANSVGINLTDAVSKKIELNEERFPPREDLNSPPRREK